MDKKYKPGWGRGLFIITVPAIGLFIGAWDSPHLELTDPAALFFLAAFWISGLEAIIGSFALLKDNQFCVTSYFAIKQCLRVDEITSIAYLPTWKVGQTSRSVYVVKEETDKKISLQMTNVGYREKTLAQVITDLKGANPKIILDEHAITLTQKYATSRS